MRFMLGFLLPSALNSENFVIRNQDAVFSSELTIKAWAGERMMGENILSEHKMPIVI